MGKPKALTTGDTEDPRGKSTTGRGADNKAAGLFGLQQSLRLIGNKHCSLGFGIRFERLQVLAGGRCVIPEFNLGERESGLQFVESIAKLVRGNKHSFELMAGVRRLTGF